MINSTQKNLLANLGLSTSLFEEAFTHGSINKGLSFERLEFLGDSLIEACVTMMIFKAFPEASEGQLSRWRSVLVNQKTLAKISCELELPKNLKAHPDQRNDLIKNTRIQASLFESLCGAIALNQNLSQNLNQNLNQNLSQNLNQNLNQAFSFIEEHLEPYLKNVDQSFKESNPKTILQELTQKNFKITPKYTKEEITGPSHAPSFVVFVWLGDKKISSAKGSSLKEAEQEAARFAHEVIKKEFIGSRCGGAES